VIQPRLTDAVLACRHLELPFDDGVLRPKTFRSASSSSRSPTPAFLRADGSIVISTLAARAEWQFNSFFVARYVH